MIPTDPLPSSLLIDQNQKMTVAAMQMVDMKVCASAITGVDAPPILDFGGMQDLMPRAVRRHETSTSP